MSQIVRLASKQRASRAVLHNGTIFLSGQTADDRDLDVRDQMRQVLAKIDRLLTEVGADKSRLLYAQIWLKDIRRDFAGMNEVWDAWTAPGAAPARATGQCELGAPDVLVEVIVTAAAILLVEQQASSRHALYTPSPG